MGLAQVIEMRQQRLNFLAPVGGFEHVVADEFRKAVNVFNRNRLVEHVDRLASHLGAFGDPAKVFCWLFRGLKPERLEMLSYFIRLVEPVEARCQITTAVQNRVDAVVRITVPQIQNLQQRESLT